MATHTTEKKRIAWLPDKVDVLNQDGKVVAHEPLDKAVFDGYINHDLMNQAIETYLANLRQGTLATKTRGMVRGGGKKPWRQKGTGRARFGSIRTPIWRHGGITFGPQPRDFNKKFPKRMNTLALKSALNAKLKDSEIIFLDDIRLKHSKTKDFYSILKKLNLTEQKVLFLKKDIDETLHRSYRNIPLVTVYRAEQVNTYTLINCKRLIVTKDALAVLLKRVKGS